jgi:hypothetical protein
MKVRIRHHQPKGIPKTGSFEVQIEGQDSHWFYYDDVAGRRLRPEQMTSEQALAAAREFARSVRKT